MITTLCSHSEQKKLKWRHGRPSREERPGVNILRSPDLALLSKPLWMDQNRRAVEMEGKVGIQREDIAFSKADALSSALLQPLP